MSVPITKPTVGGSNNTWGTTLNTALDALNSADFWVGRTADSAAITSSTLADDAVLQVTLPTGTFRCDVGVAYTSASTAVDLKMAWAFTGTLSNGFRFSQGVGSTNAAAITAATPLFVGAAGISTASITSAAVYGASSVATDISWAWETGWIVATAGGIFKIQTANNNNSLNLVVKAGSFIHIRQVA